MSSTPTQTMHLTLDDGELPVELFLPPSGSGPGLVLVQEIFGVSAYIRDRAADLAALGYVVAVPELYWRIGVVATAEDGDINDILAEGMGAANRVGLAHAIADTTATLAWFPERPEVTGPVGLIGFCFGGGVAFAVAAQTNPALLISYYGSSIPDQVDSVGAVTVPSLHHWGTADAFIPLDVQDRVRQAIDGPHVEWHSYDGANHAFDNPNPAFHHPDASALAWQRTEDFLRRLLPTD
ncbi:dienelactone hydrolase family protein [Gordonia sp. CPCC 205515]|uniref:dienelactone hydrolase family protein n=1 Tax=Gordonia sp. CPCC 205515 TaxID=3140791 RepID=UPI003AF385F0